MAGLMFVVCVPTSEHERNMIENIQRKSVFSKNASDDSLHKSSNNSDSMTNLKRTSLITDNIGKEIESKCTPYKSPSLSSIETKSEKNDISINMSDSKNGKNGRQEEELSRIIMRKGITDWAKLPHHEGDLPMEKMLEKVLKKMQIENAVWCAGESGRYYQVFFSVGSGDHAEEILRHLKEAGIGIKLNSVVSVMPCALYYQGKQQELEQQQIIDDFPNADELDSDRRFSSKTSAWDKFVMSVRARLTVAQVVEGVKANANLTFDFLFLLTISSFVAAIGLVENSTVILVASMLISPLMGPIMAGTFGTVIEDKYLQKIGVLNEIFGLLVCILVGFVFGLAAGLANEHWGNAGWPTEEMANRGLVRSLWVGVLVALASGAAVAVAVLVNNTASLVGVAISASLMPPAVNAGLLWALSFMDWLRPGRMQLENEDFDPNDPPTYTPVYSDTPAIELAVLGAVSLGLTFVNIVCIFISGILVLKIKEVAPRNSRDEEQFWKHDIKLARDYNRTLTGQDADDLKARPSLKDLQNNMNHALMVNSESNNYIETESHKIRRHSGGPWTLNKEQSTLQVPGIICTSSTASTSCNTIPNSCLDIIEENNYLCPPRKLPECNVPIITLDSHFERENNISYVTEKSRFTVTRAPDPILHV
ncbi:hypothetical protein C0J52_24856 [Blattella germanica]|nr:hypothetical protein C0J52_24856 [Blattella germanica]